MQPSQMQNDGGQIAMGSSLAEGGAKEDSMMTEQERNHAGPTFLPAAERSRPPMQLEPMEEQPIDLQQFLDQSDEDDVDKLEQSHDGLLK